MKVLEIKFTLRDGTSKLVEVRSGMTVMQAAQAAAIDGVLAECGGCLMCATCHVHVARPWLDKLPPVTRNEHEMLDCTEVPRIPESRLSCQIVMTEELNGLEISIPSTH